MFYKNTSSFVVITFKSFPFTPIIKHSVCTCTMWHIDTGVTVLCTVDTCMHVIRHPVTCSIKSCVC